MNVAAINTPGNARDEAGLRAAVAASVDVPWQQFGDPIDGVIGDAGKHVAQVGFRDKIAASKKKGMWMGGVTPLGYAIKDRKLGIVPEDAPPMRLIPCSYCADGSGAPLQ